MSRLAWSQLRFRSGRALALLLGMFIAATAACLPARAMRRLPAARVLAEE